VSLSLKLNLQKAEAKALKAVVPLPELHTGNWL
jgi:hypothetical protein